MLLDDLRSGASAARDSICGVLTGTSDPSMVCLQVGVLLFGKVLGVAWGTPFKGIGSSWLELLCWIQIFFPVDRMWWRFCLRVPPLAMVMTYKRGVCVLHLTMPGSHLWLCGLSTRTGSSGCMAGKVLEALSYCDFCWCCLAWSLTLLSPSAHSDRLGLDMVGRLVWSLLSLRARLVMRCCGQVGCCEGITWQGEDQHQIFFISGVGSSQSVCFSLWNHWLEGSID